MPVKRLHSLEEAEDSLVLDRHDPRLMERIGALWALSHRLAPAWFPPGLYKHRSIEELNRQTERWEAENVRRAQERKLQHPGE